MKKCQSNLVYMLYFKQFLTLVIFVWFSTTGRAQTPTHDVVYYTSGEAVHCDLIGVTENTVRYRLSDAPDGEVYNELRDDILLIFKRNGEFLLPAEPGVVWKAGSQPDFDNIVTDNSQVFPAVNIEEHEDIIYYQDPIDSTDASVTTAETVAIIYRDGRHKLLTDVNDVAIALSGALAFAIPIDSSSEDAIASTGSMAAPLPDDSSDETMPDEETTEDAPDEVVAEEEEEWDMEPEEEAVAEAEIETEDTAVAFEDEESPEGDEVAEAPPALEKEMELSDADYEEYAAKAINKAEYLGHYLDLLCNNELDTYDKEQAIESALKLFVHDSTLVQVSSVTQDETVTYKINEYLKHLTLLDYDKVELLWRNVQYVTKFRLAPDGNYYGTITVEQLFQGFKDGKPMYEDVTQKDIEIVLGNFKREESGTTEYVWDVLLSDIGVEETRRR